jgi:hypothetical protein
MDLDVGTEIIDAALDPEEPDGLISEPSAPVRRRAIVLYVLVTAAFLIACGVALFR